MFYSGNDDEKTMMFRGEGNDESKMSHNDATSGKFGLLNSKQSDAQMLGLNGTLTTRQNTDTLATDIQAMTNSIG